MDDEFDNDEAADAADSQLFREEMAGARARDDQIRFEKAAAAQKFSPEDVAAAATAGAGAGSAQAEASVPSLEGRVTDAITATSNYVSRLPENLTLGLMDTAVNTGRMMWNSLRDSLVDSGDYGDEQSTGSALLGDKQYTTKVAPAPSARGMTPAQLRETSDQRAEHKVEQAALPTPLDEQVAAAYDAWRNGLNDDSNMADLITQGAAQFLVPFTAFSKAFGVSRSAGLASNALRLGAAETVTSMAALDPRAGRMADLLKMGTQAENRFGDLMRAAAPDGSLQNQYIEWMVDREGESDSEGRFKNAVDSLGVSAALGTIFKIAGTTFKTARTGVQKVKDVLDEKAAEREFADAMLARKAGVKPSGKGFEETHTGLVFEKDTDAAELADELAHQFGSGFEARRAEAWVNASDKNFATLHSFANVLKANADKPVKTASLIDALERNIKGDTETGAFYKELLGRLKAKNLGGMTTVTSEAGTSPTLRGGFVPGSNAVKLYPHAFDDGPEKLLHTFTHEAVHAATVRAVRESPEATAKLNRLHRRITAAFADSEAGFRNEDLRGVAAGVEVPPKAPKGDFASEAARGASGTSTKKTHYGFTDPEEFIAEIESNPEFRKLMKETVVDGESAWDKYKKAIGGILGIATLAASPEFDKLMDPKQEEEDAGA